MSRFRPSLTTKIRRHDGASGEYCGGTTLYLLHKRALDVPVDLSFSTAVGERPSRGQEMKSARSAVLHDVPSVKSVHVDECRYIEG
jgi:hypothetical protein